MTTKNKIAFVLFSLSIVIIALAAIFSYRMGLDWVIVGSMYSVAAVVLDTALILWIGFARFLRYVYLMFVFGMVLFCAAFVVATDNVLVWIGSGVVSVLLIASLIPVVFKSR
jgi:hypothetical protein